VARSGRELTKASKARGRAGLPPIGGIPDYSSDDDDGDDDGYADGRAAATAAESSRAGAERDPVDRRMSGRRHHPGLHVLYAI
ncbi:hypothetical protein LOY97_006828, partial [Ophidiomyces ophidiicola]